MKSFAWYDLQVMICSAILMSYYFLVLRNKRFHQYNRFYLLALFFLSFLIPLIKIQLDKMGSRPAVVQFIYVLADYNASIDAAVAQKGFQVNWDLMLELAYIAVSVAFLLLFVRALIRIRTLLQQYDCKDLGDVYLILTNVRGTPFSFFRYIFWNEEIDLQSATGQQILQHELTHVKEKHSVDNIITQVVMIFGWFNPFFWWARKELQMIHEFIADQKSVDKGDASALAAMLLTAIYPQQQYLLTNSFFFSPIKRRILMITNNKNPRFSYLRRVIVLPLMAVVVMLFAFRMKEQKLRSIIDSRNTKVLSDTTKPINDSLKLVKQKISIVDTNGFVTTTDNNVVINASSIKFNDSASFSKFLFIVDGVKQDHNVLNEINSNGIASITLLQGKSAISKYGNPGKNGVFEIRMKMNEGDLRQENKSTTVKVIPISSFADGKQPLIVVDGRVIPNMEMSKINPNDIASVNVLKDNAAIEKYSDAAKNGVIEIKLKHNTDNEPEIYSGPVTLKFDRNHIDQLPPKWNSVKQFLQRNDEVQELSWEYSKNEASAIHIQLKDGTIETYDIKSAESVKRAENKYGTIPVSPTAVSINIPVSFKMDSLSPESFEKIFTEVQEPASFPGGQMAWQKYLMRNLNVAVPVKNGAAPGKYAVKLNFIVDDKGIVSRVKIDNDPGYGTAEEAMRIIKNGPTWIPAKQNGYVVTSLVKQTITFVVSK